MQGLTQSVRAIFDRALELAAPEDRHSLVEEACANRPDLRDRLTALLHAHEAACDFLETPAADFHQLFEELATPAAETALALGNADDSLLDCLDPPAQAGHLGRLGHYQVLEVIGKGAMGIVLKAHDETLGRVVAIKVMTPALAADGDARKRFTREARAMAAVRHDNVIDIHSVDEANGVPFLVMEYVADGSLQARLQGGMALPSADIVRIGRQLAAGLAAAHAAGLIHRDIKPANILLAGDRVKITDFGLVRQQDEAGLSQSGLVIGTPQYMSPEQARGEAIDHRCDLFGLGGVLYALCTGRAPFAARGTMATLRSVCDEEPPRIRDLNPDTPPWLEEIVERLLEKAPARRFQSAADVGACLERGVAPLDECTNVAGPLRLFRPRRRVWLAATGLAALCLVLTEATGVTQFFSALTRPGGDANVVATAPSVDNPLGRVDPAADARAPSSDEAKPSLAEVAERKYRELLKRNPNDLGALYHLGVVLNTRQKWQEAEEILRRTVELNGVDVAARVQLAVALRMQGKYPEAEAETLVLIRQHPKNAAHHSNLGTILVLQDKLAEAEEAFRESHRLLPSATTLGQLINVLYKQGKGEEAAELQRERQRLLNQPKKMQPADPPASIP